MSDEIRVVEIDAEVRQIKTMADSSVNVVLNVPEYCIEQVKAMLGWQGNQVKVVIEKLAVRPQEQTKGVT